MREGVCPNSRVDLRRFFTGPPPNIVEWSVLNANVLDFRYVFALLNYGANCLRLGIKNGANFGPVRFRGHFEEIAVANVLLNTKPHHVGKFRGCWFSDV